MQTFPYIVSRADSDERQEVAHFDTGQIIKSEKRPNGGKVYFGIISQADSVLEYRNKDGSTRKELCLSDELFNKDSIDSARMVPFCSPHPTYGLTVRKVDRKGYTGSRIGANESATHLVVDFVIDDASIQRKMDSGDLGGLSMGYTCWHQPVMGGVIKDSINRAIREDNGGIYGSPDKARKVLARLDSQFEDGETIYLQRDRRYYHLAGVKTPRAPDAATVSFRLDSGEDAYTTIVPMPSDSREDTSSSHHEDLRMTTVAVRLDGQTLNTDSPDKIEAVNTELTKLRADNAALLQEKADMEEKMKDMGEKEEMYDMSYEAADGSKMTARVSGAGKAMYDMMKKDMDEMQGKQDSADSELETLRKDAVDRALVELKTATCRAMGMNMDSFKQMETAKDVQLTVIGLANRLDANQLAEFAERSDEAIAATYEQIILGRAQSMSRQDSDAPFEQQQKIVDAATPVAVNPSQKQDMGTGFPMAKKDKKSKFKPLKGFRMSAAMAPKY